MTDDWIDYLRDRIDDADLESWAEELLLDLCSIDTTLGSDLERLAAGEKDCFDLLTTAMVPYLSDNGVIRTLPVPSTIADDTYYTFPYYAESAAADLGRVYAGRGNLFIDEAPNVEGPYWLLNAHVDTVPPHIAPRRKAPGVVSGRGTADDKGALVTMAVVARLLAEARIIGLRVSVPVRWLVSIDEEMGGNGTLGAVTALEELEQARVVVMEPTSLQPFSANRGAVWFSVRAEAKTQLGRQSLWGLLTEIGKELAAFGRELQNHSESHLFSKKDVQTCFGVIGPFGHHPSSACNRVELRWNDSGSRVEEATSLVQKCLANAVAAKRLSHEAPEPVVKRDDREPSTLHVRIEAQDGHMGSHERDTDAIGKAMEIVEALKKEGFGLPEWDGPSDGVLFEGGQGFLPDRHLEDVMESLRAAFDMGLKRGMAHEDLHSEDITASIHFDKLHNAAFCSANAAIGPYALADALGRIWKEDPPELRGWMASCDARIFARRCPDVTTFGPGELKVAHSSGEEIEVTQIVRAAAAIVAAILQADGEAE